MIRREYGERIAAAHRPDGDDVLRIGARQEEPVGRQLDVAGPMPDRSPDLPGRRVPDRDDRRPVGRRDRGRQRSRRPGSGGRRRRPQARRPRAGIGPVPGPRPRPAGRGPPGSSSAIESCTAGPIAPKRERPDPGGACGAHLVGRPVPDPDTAISLAHQQAVAPRLRVEGDGVVFLGGTTSPGRPRARPAWRRPGIAARDPGGSRSASLARDQASSNQPLRWGRRANPLHLELKDEGFVALSPLLRLGVEGPCHHPRQDDPE